MDRIVFSKENKYLIYAKKNKEYIASIFKRDRRNLYDVTFFNNQKIKCCLVKSLKTAKELILMYEGQDV